MSSETTDDGEPATGGVALPPTDASPERKEEILAVLSAVIDPGKKNRLVYIRVMYVCNVSWHRTKKKKGRVLQRTRHGTPGHCRVPKIESGDRHPVGDVDVDGDVGFHLSFCSIFAPRGV